MLLVELFLTGLISIVLMSFARIDILIIASGSTIRVVSKTDISVSSRSSNSKSSSESEKEFSLLIKLSVLTL
ncbi:12279_t:CDS:2 [Funneliformis caledonium]|uniref:12279_t:CDS:1 n=1 Tax=Funneliformis caledonium TaxID=1117310 RepID=A0A9N9AB95_9GLOM|nr:12279_t:CDS:2 [Funneliformis caledonium]